MNYFTSNRNIKIPNMIYGTAWKKERTPELVAEALECGFRGVDTAGQPKHYQEHLVGEGLLKAYESGLKREDLYLQTKFTPIDGQDRSNMPYLESDDIVTQIEKSFANSKKNLHTDFIDSYVLHSPIFPGTLLLKAWDVMSSFVRNNEVGQIGISNCYELDVLGYLNKKAEIKPSVVQNRFYQNSGYDKDIRIWCNDRGVIYQSFWSLTANPHILESQIVQELSKKYEKSEAMIFYKFLNQSQIIPLNGTTSKTHMIEDIQIDSFSLEKEEVENLLKLLK